MAATGTRKTGHEMKIFWNGWLAEPVEQMQGGRENVWHYFGSAEALGALEIDRKGRPPWK
jgi:hypothetical protein